MFAKHRVVLGQAVSQPALLACSIPVHPSRTCQCIRRSQVACHAAQHQHLAATLAALILTSSAPSWAAVAETSPPGTNLGFMSDQEVQERREELGFKRAFDGRVAILNRKSKSLWDVKLDLKSPGTLLFRSPDGLVHYLAYDSLKQIDLSDDEVVGAIASSPWETGVKAVEAMDEKNETHKFELTREGFYELISVVDP